MVKWLLLLISAFMISILPVFSSQSNEKTINLIYQSMDTSLMWEIDWIDELLSEIEYNKHWDNNYETVIDNSIIVISVSTDPRLGSYLNKFKEKNYKFGIIHLSDEAYHFPTYFYPEAKFVLRNYWHKRFLNQNNVFLFL